MALDISHFQNRPMRMHGPLGEKKMFLMRAEVQEGLSQLTETKLEFLTTEKDLDMGKVVGEPIAIEVDYEDGKKHRYFHGHCTRVQYLGINQGLGHYRCELRPWLWFLTLRREMRVFQDMSIIDIMKKIFQEEGFSDVKYSGSAKKREYCVQYDETNFAFVSRLMEQEGFYYFFEHEKSKHTLMITDSVGAHKPVKDATEIKFKFAEGSGYRRKDDHIFEWRGYEAVTTGQISLTDYDFEKPKSDLKVSKKVPKGKHKHKSYEAYSYPGQHRDTGLGDIHAKVRMEAEAVQWARTRGACNVRTMMTGATFKLKEHPQKEQNDEYLVISAKHDIRLETDYENDDQKKSAIGDMSQVNEDSSPDSYRCVFEAIPKKEPFRAPLDTPWPRVVGVQTAVVTGPKGDEIHTDKHGRIKLQFHWDREGKKDDKSSCWVRVMTPWSGQSWGMIHIPRIGQEVVVQFENGDPDRPLVTGCVYNGTNKPPYSLPANMTQSGIKTNKSKGGGGFNELLFEDKKEKEFVRLQSERDYTEIIKNNADISIGYEHKDKGNLVHKVYQDRTETVEKGDYKRTIKTGSETVDIKKDRTMKIGAKEDRDVGSSFKEKVGSTAAYDIGTSCKWDIGTTLEIKAGTKITLKVGSNSIEISNSGITMKGMNVKADAKMKFEATAKLGAKLESKLKTEVLGTMCDLKAKALLNVEGTLANVKGKGLLVLKGGLTMIN